MRTLLLPLIIATAAFASAGSAASLGGAGSPRLVAGSAAVASCDGDGFGISHGTAGGRVATVTVSGISDPGCSGGVLRVMLTSSGTAVAGGGPIAVPTDGDANADALTLNVNPQPAAGEVDGFSVSVVGP